ncbi:MAG: nicotinate-nucleotide adenylyltransferase [Dehalococcoidia bacterium]|nr:nicotinate-nucleotide adenylyltransferase [Dehalococcoidia bacterium]
MRIGIFGGTFDPIHNGHLAVAEYVRTEVALDQVLFVPAGQPWFKEGQTVTDARRRLEMTRLAVADNPHFAVSDMEVRRDGPTYTSDTLTELRRNMGEGAEFYLILGIDALNELHRWHKPCDVLHLATVVGVTRPGAETVERAALDSIREGASDEVVIVDGPLIDISAADIRRRMSEGLSVRGIIPQAVEDYARRHVLYGSKE